MGNVCAPNDIYQQIKQQYAQHFQKFIIGQQIKIGLRFKINQLNKKIKRVANSIRTQKIAEINQKQRDFKNRLDESKAMVDKYYLGGVRGLQKQQKCKFQQIIGFNTMEHNFNLLKETINTKFSEQQQKMRRQLQKIRITKKDKITKQQPKIEFFDLLPDRTRQKVYIRATKDFRQKIQYQTNYFLVPLQKTCENIVDRFKIIQKQQELQSISNEARRVMRQKLRLIVGNVDEVDGAIN